MLLASGACLVLKRHRTLDFLDLLFDRMALMEHSERTALDKRCDELVQEEKGKSARREGEVHRRPCRDMPRSMIPQYPVRVPLFVQLQLELKDAEAALAVLRAQGERALALEQEKSVGLQQQLAAAKASQRAAQEAAAQAREVSAQHVCALHQLCGSVAAMEQRTIIQQQLEVQRTRQVRRPAQLSSPPLAPPSLLHPGAHSSTFLPLPPLEPPVGL